MAVAVRVRIAIVALALVGVACGGRSASGGPGSASPTGASGGASPGCACIETLPPVSNALCRAAAAPIAAIQPIKDALGLGSIGDGAAESEVLGIQQALVTDAQEAGLQNPISVALEGVVSALGELGVLLNQNRSAPDLEPAYAGVDQAVTTLAAACSAAG